MTLPIASRLFEVADQLRFAEYTGDRNPMHMDALAARRSQAGAPVVHGIHCVLWALESLIEVEQVSAPVNELRAEFRKFLYVGSQASLRVARTSDSSLRAEVLIEGGQVAVVIDVGLGQRAATRPAALAAAPIPIGQAPSDLEFDAVAVHSGVLPLSRHEIIRDFPLVARIFGERELMALGQLSTLVGMVCPGLHSIFESFDLDLTAQPGAVDALSFAVRDVDTRVRLVRIGVVGPGMAGEVSAFVRQRPVPQLDLSSVAQRVRRGEFAQTRALIIGGSRGIGALTAKIIVAGGGSVVLTYARGQAEAADLVAELGGRSQTLRYDAREDAAPQLHGLCAEISQMYYFATPQIFRQKSRTYTGARFREFCEIYVDGFYDAVTSLRQQAPSVRCFYPSSVAVEAHPRDMTEYAMAKAAGEVLCADINRFERGCTVLIRRLPRILTDQTATVMPVESSDALDVMLPAVREMHAPHTK